MNGRRHTRLKIESEETCWSDDMYDKIIVRIEIPLRRTDNSEYGEFNEI